MRGAGARGAGASGGAQGGVRPVGVAVRPPAVGISVRRAARSRDAGPKGTEFEPHHLLPAGSPPARPRAPCLAPRQRLARTWASTARAALAFLGNVSPS